MFKFYFKHALSGNLPLTWSGGCKHDNPGPYPIAMEWYKLYNPKQMNSFQFIALTGVIMTGLAHVLLNLWGKEVDSFNYLYLCWGVLFGYGSIQNLRHKPEDDHHHHH